MLQRIQTVFLLLSALSLGGYLILPLIGLEASGFSETLPGWRVGHAMVIAEQSYIVFFNAVFTGTAMALTAGAVFLFKNRPLQSLLTVFAMVFTLSAAAFVWYKYQTKVFMGDVLLTPWALLAPVAVIFQLLALVYIRKDERLVKSLDRLR